MPLDARQVLGPVFLPTSLFQPVLYYCKALITAWKSIFSGTEGLIKAVKFNGRRLKRPQFSQTLTELRSLMPFAREQQVCIDCQKITGQTL